MEDYRRRLIQKRKDRKIRNMTIKAVLCIFIGALCGVTPYCLYHGNVITNQLLYYILLIVGLMICFAGILYGANLIHDIFDEACIDKDVL